ncbi:hypothetical protein B0H11DRAFT_1935756 [Mycena galericulata]|nr:hypothetical protein B0H11DRAFT_1941352 [Mycena galericulata]KAJ7437689.1 hypothetical protein B0H11DRAFT_1935756 [Mycena galericulata]
MDVTIFRIEAAARAERTITQGQYNPTLKRHSVSNRLQVTVAAAAFYLQSGYSVMLLDLPRSICAVRLPFLMHYHTDDQPSAAFMPRDRCLDNCSLRPTDNSVGIASRFVVVARCRRGICANSSTWLLQLPPFFHREIAGITVPSMCSRAATGVTQMPVRACPVTIIRGHSASVIFGSRSVS